MKNKFKKELKIEETALQKIYEKGKQPTELQIVSKKLNKQQKRFVEEYMQDLNATKAAIRAGYSKKTAKQQGSRLLSHVDVQAYFALKAEKRAKRTEVKEEFVISELIEIYERCKAIEPITDAWGKKTGFYKFNSKGALQALHLLGLHLGMFKTVVSNDPKNPIPSGQIIFYLPQNGREKLAN